jgi:hypothetical protein
VNVFIFLLSTVLLDSAVNIFLFLFLFIKYFILNLFYAVSFFINLFAHSYIWVCAPFRAKKWCTLKKARIVVALAAAFSFLVNMHYLFTVQRIYRGGHSIAGDGYYTCYTSKDPTASISV